MEKTTTTLPEIKLVGISARTNNANMFEMNPTNNKIAATVQQYFHGGLLEKIEHRKIPGVTCCVYTDYESDFTGDYTYFIGEEVEEFTDMTGGFVTHTIPEQIYTKFTNGPAPMPGVCIAMWQQIWQMTPDDFGGQRAYIADFEVYDERALDHQNVILDIYIGIKK
jgi:predicted transcriptional regulator YdeE